MKIRLDHIASLALGLLLTALSSHAAPTVPLSSATLLDSRDSSVSMPSLQRGHDALARKDYATAMREFEAASKQAPNSALPFLALAELARIRNQRDLVDKWLGEAIRVAPKNAWVLSAWGSWHYALGDYAKAEAFKQSAVIQEPGNPNPLIDLGDLYFNALGQPEKAADFYRRALAINPALSGARYALGMTLLFGGKPDAALIEFKESARSSPGNPLPLQAIGRALIELGDFSGAISAFNQVLKVQPGFVDAILGKGDALRTQGKLEGALAEYGLAVRSNPKQGDVHMKQGMALQGLGRMDEALGAYRTAVQLEPGLAIAHNNLAWLSAERKDVADRGLSSAQKAIALNAAEPRFKGTLAWVHFRRGEAVAALQILEPLVLAEAKAIPETHFMLGQIYASMGNKTKAIMQIREALRLDVSFSQAVQAKDQLRRLERE